MTTRQALEHVRQTARDNGDVIAAGMGGDAGVMRYADQLSEQATALALRAGCTRTAIEQAEQDGYREAGINLPWRR